MLLILSTQLGFDDIRMVRVVVHGCRWRQATSGAARRAIAA